LNSATYETSQLRRATLYPAELRAPMGLDRPNARQRQRPWYCWVLLDWTMRESS